MAQSQINETTLTQDFENLERQALKEISLEIIKTDLLKSLKDQHLTLMDDLEKKMKRLENRCAREIEEGLENGLNKQLEKHFRAIVASNHSDISAAIKPLLRRAEADLQGLNNAVHQTNELCQEIQGKYAFRWDKPFLTLILCSILTGVVMGVILFLMQTSPLALFLMNKETRAIYDEGLVLTEFRKKRTQSTPDPVKQEELKVEQKHLKKQKKK